MHNNRLAHEKSPYLLQHAHNPVDWFPWGPEAWEKARAENKPVFLSVGYSACHWCHVMERESFEVESTAELLNAHFVCVKVDREERPDVDEIYMTAVQMLTGHGGWPMSVFLTPDGLPFYGGTYFPPESRGGRISFPSLLTQLADAWQNRRGEVEEVAQNIAGDLQTAVQQKPAPVASGGALDAQSLLDAAVADMATRFDAQNGGFGGAPKFPPHHALRLLTRAARDGSAEAARMLTVTLDKMALGGIYDHIGGGFHRYSTDAVWLLPHFEKMLYDNALLARVYADAFDATGNGAYMRIALETCDWVLRDMTEPANGGFHAALDADSEGVEGKFYVWTPAEVAAVLGASKAQAFCAAYHIVSGGNFCDEATGHQSGESIPYLAIGAASPVTLPDVLEPHLSVSRARLCVARNKRVWPGKDDKVITAWNGLMIGALAFCAKTFDEPHYYDAARRAADFCLTTLRDSDGRLLRRWAKGDAGLPGFLEDYAYLADGLLDLYDATGEEKWQEAARELADILLTDFHDTENGGFFTTRQTGGGEKLIAQAKDLFDGATPSANGVAVRILVRLGELPNGETYQAAARQTLEQFGGLLTRVPQGTATLTLAAVDALPETESPPAPVRLEAQPARTGGAVVVPPGTLAMLSFLLRIAPGFHVNAPDPTNKQTAVKPLTAVFSSDAPAGVGPVGFPPAQPWDDQTGGPSVPVYSGNVAFTIEVDVPAHAALGNYHVSLALTCQPCNETECLPPVTVSASIPIIVSAGA